MDLMCTTAIGKYYCASTNDGKAKTEAHKAFYSPKEEL